MKKLIGYDVDGVATEGVRPNPGEDAVYISGRTRDEFDRTVSCLGTDHAIYLRPYGEYGDAMLAGTWKAEMIRLLGVTKFYEDNASQASLIKRLCPNCEVVMVIGGKPME